MSSSLDSPQAHVSAVNIGLAAFGQAVRDQGAEAVDVKWQIPAGGDDELVRALVATYLQASEGIDAANDEVIRRLNEGTPVLVGVAPAAEVVPGVGDGTLLHAGPPLPWERFCGPLRRSAQAAAVAEGWAESPEKADALITAGDVTLAAANEHATVLPMATVVGPSAPVFVVDNPEGGNRAFSALNQGPGKVAWFGVADDESVARLRWLRDVAGGVLNEVLEAHGPIDLLALAAQGLQMGDDLHMRVQAATNLFVRAVLPSLAGVGDNEGRVAVADYLASNHLFFLNLAMAAAKSITDWAAGVEGSSIVIGMSRNGTTFGIRLAGMPDRWFITDAPLVGDELYHGDFGRDDAAPDIGDSAVLELVGLGGSAAAASPAVTQFLGGSFSEALDHTEKVERICAGRSTRFQIPYLDYRPTPLGVDVRRVVELGIAPSINTGILDSEQGFGQIGAGVAEAPLACFREALLALAR